MRGRKERQKKGKKRESTRFDSDRSTKEPNARRNTFKGGRSPVAVVIKPAL